MLYVCVFFESKNTINSQRYTYWFIYPARDDDYWRISVGQASCGFLVISSWILGASTVPTYPTGGGGIYNSFYSDQDQDPALLGDVDTNPGGKITFVQRTFITKFMPVIF